MKIAIIGTGYVGLTSGAGFAEFGHEVTCADIDKDKIAALQAGRIPFHEPNLPELVARHVAAGRLCFTASVKEAVRGAEILFLAVGTPQGQDGHADLFQVLAAADAVGAALDIPGAIVVTKSTVPVGTTERVRAAVLAKAQVSFTVASNPEFLKEGDAVRDFLRPDRVVLGVEDAETAARLRQLYQSAVRDPAQILVMGIRSAELTKYASNAMLAVRISFMNDIANLCEKVGADIQEVRHGVGMDSRIGDRFLYAGIGYGGSCFPKDVAALAATGRQHDCRQGLVEAAQQTNGRQVVAFFHKIRLHFLQKEPLPDLHPAGAPRPRGVMPELQGRTVAVWGLSFKPETDDIREAPALRLVSMLLTAGAKVRATDPAAMDNARSYLVDRVQDERVRAEQGKLEPPPRFLLLSLLADPYEAARGADALVLATEWRAYRQPDWGRLRDLMAGKVLFDGRNVWDRPAAEAAGFTYYGVGR